MELTHEVSKEKAEVRIVADKRNQDKHEVKTLADSALAIQRKKQELEKAKRDNACNLEYFHME